MHTPGTTNLHQPWYLIANRESLSVKIHENITVGEDAEGVLVLNSRVPDQRWLTLTVDPAGHLAVSTQADDYQLECPGKWVAHVAGANVPKGTVFELPHNQVYVSGNLQRGQAVQKVLVKRVEEAAADARSEPQSEPEPGMQPEAPASAPAAAVAAEVVAAEIVAAEPVAAELEEPPTVAQPSPAGQSRSNRWIWSGVLAAGVVGVGVLVMMAGRPAEEMARPPAQSPGVVSAPLATDAAVAQPREAIAEEVTEPILSDEPVAEIAATRIASEAMQVEIPSGLPTSDATSNLEPVPIDVTARLALAEQLYQDGFVVWPAENAMAVLVEVLQVEPENADAQEMLNVAAEGLVLEARRAAADGFPESALSVVDDVLRYYPQHEPAVALRSQLNSEG